MLGDNVEMSRDSFDPYLPDHKDGFYELDQIRPGVVICPFCNDIIDATQELAVLQVVDALKVWPDSWASVPLCECNKGLYAVYYPRIKKWAFRYQIRKKGTDKWQKD